MPARLHEYRVKIDKTHQEKVSFDSGVELYQDVWFNPEEKVTLIGTVTYVPPTDTMGIKKGDIIFFRYDVVGDSDVDNWDQRIYHNLIVMPDGSKEWHVHPDMVIGKDENGHLVARPGIVIGKPVMEKAWTSSILITTEVSEKRAEHLMDVVYAHPESGYHKGQRIMVLPQYVQRYNLKSHHGQDILMVKEKYVLAKAIEA